MYISVNTVPFKKLKSTKAWKLTSELVRKLAKGRCYTCGRIVPFSKLVAGHAIEKIGKAGIYFDLDCLRGQCQYCNRRLHGNYAVYTLKLIKEIGEERVRRMHKRARPKQWSKEELKEIEKDRQVKINNNE